jgi:hypothetical protein
MVGFGYVKAESLSQSTVLPFFAVGFAVRLPQLLLIGVLSEDGMEVTRREKIKKLKINNVKRILFK